MTPARVRDDVDDNGSTEDLIQDSAYEQTSIGLEWIAPLAGVVGSTAHVLVKLSIYARVLPTFEEQEKSLSWKRRRPVSDPTEPESEIVPVWKRIDLSEMAVEVDFDELRLRRKLIVPLTPKMQALWREQRSRQKDAYPTSSPLFISKSQFKEENFESWCSGIKPTRKNEDWAADVDVRLTSVPLETGCARVSLRLINRTPQGNRAASEFFDPNLYAARLTVIIPRAAHKDRVFRELEQSYRYNLQLPAIGLNCHAEVSREGEALVLRTESVPTAEYGRLEPRVLAEVTPSFQALSTNPVPVLYGLLEAMREYDKQKWQKKIGVLSGSQRDEAERDRQRYRAEISTFERGIALLEDTKYPLVSRAFRLMNEAINDVATGNGLILEKVVRRRSYTDWRLFQIVFIVSQLPILAAREYPELAREGDDHVDILWFAAGGGKTEAFLGVIVWQAFFDRLRGKEFGSAALVRFPLRLLAFQQLQRTARALAAADVIRVREKLGGASFSLGYYVGGTQTPNAINDELHQRYSSGGIDPTERKIAECPYCGTDVRVAYNSGQRLIEHRCSNSSCPNGISRLPVYIVDRDVERFLPTVVVATVDKLAQFGQQQRFANLFGRISLMCGRHGASFRDTEGRYCLAAKAIGPGPMDPPRVTDCNGMPVFYPPFHDLGPALLVQDELHLLSEELGTFDAHYETAAIALSKTLGLKPWKIIGATATIAGFAEHAQQLYLKDARQFPAPGPEAFDSFYYTLNEKQIGRLFVGIVGIGRKHTPAVTKALSLIYQELQLARDLAKGSLDAACARYGLATLAEDEFRMMLYYYELALTYVLTRKGSDQVAEAIETRVKRELADVSEGAGELRVETFNGSVDMSEMIEAMRSIERADPTLGPEERTRGLVATNIIGHGVDVDRFNIIVFAGFTRLVAEYIQASARVGRRFPGISVHVATPQSERDRSIYERFTKFHEYLDRLVDPSAINRWPIPALRRTIPGLLAGYLMGAAAGTMNRRMESIERVQSALGTSQSAPLRETEVVKWMQEALGADTRPDYASEVENIVRNNYALIVNAEPSRSFLENLLSVRLQSMRSLRDVDDPADIVVELKEDQEIMRGLLRG